MQQMLPVQQLLTERIVSRVVDIGDGPRLGIQHNENARLGRSEISRLQIHHKGFLGGRQFQTRDACAGHCRTRQRDGLLRTDSPLGRNITGLRLGRRFLAGQMGPHEGADGLGKGQIDSAGGHRQKYQQPPNAGGAMKIKVKCQPARPSPDQETAAPLAFARPPQHQSAEAHERHDDAHPTDEGQANGRRHCQEGVNADEKRQYRSALHDLGASQDFQRNGIDIDVDAGAALFGGAEAH